MSHVNYLEDYLTLSNFSININFITFSTLCIYVFSFNLISLARSLPSLLVFSKNPAFFFPI